MPHKDINKKREYHKNYYIKQKESILGGQLNRWRIAQLFIHEEKMKACMDCGFVPKIPEQMDFDHVSGNKVSSIARMVTSGKTIEVLKQEIAKCELVCANCHRLRTYKRRTDV